MITTIAPMVVEGGASTFAAQATTVAAPIWDIGANIKNQGITFAVYLLMAGTALVASWSYFISKDKTFALKTIAVGIVLIGIVGALPSLGVVSKDTVNSITNSGGYR